MKILVGQFNTESNANIRATAKVTNYDIAFGEDCIRKMQIKDVIEETGVEVIPAVYAVAGPAGVIEKDAFEYILSLFTNAVKEHLGEFDGMYLYLHGASYVQEIGSGDRMILNEVRKIVGPYMPIFAACDPHGNTSKEYCEQLTLLRSCRESPHTDQVDNYKHVFRKLVAFLNNRQNVHCIYRKLPLILGGEQSVSADEPVRSINVYLNELEQDPRIMSASWHVGYIRHDIDHAGCSVIVVPSTEADFAYCEKKADELAKFVWDRRHEFHYTGLTAQPEEALKMTVEFDGSPCVITDSGDNKTAGGAGANTYVLRQMLALKDLKKTVLFADIYAPTAYGQLLGAEIGEVRTVTIGEDYDELSTPVTLDVKVISRSQLCRIVDGQVTQVQGNTVFVHVVNTTIDIILCDDSHPIFREAQAEYMGITWQDYDITVLKQGYIFPDWKKDAKFYVMSLTNGPTLQDTARLPFKRIMRPMYPIDNI